MVYEAKPARRKTDPSMFAKCYAGNVLWKAKWLLFVCNRPRPVFMKPSRKRLFDPDDLDPTYSTFREEREVPKTGGSGALPRRSVTISDFATHLSVVDDPEGEPEFGEEEEWDQYGQGEEEEWDECEDWEIINKCFKELEKKWTWDHEFDEEIAKLASQFARQTLRPDASNLNFAQVQIPKALASKMATMQISTTADDPTEIILKAIETDNEEATELAPFTHIGIGVARVKTRFAIARIYACKMPTSIKDVREITHDQEQQLVSLINQLRKKKGLSRLKHSRRMTDRAMKYQKLLFTGVDPNSEVAMNELMNIVHDYSFKEFSGGMTTKTNDPMTEIFDQLTKTNTGDLLAAYDEIGTTIVRDQYNHWRWLISLEHY